MNPSPREDWKSPGEFWEAIDGALRWADKKTKHISASHRQWMAQHTHTHSQFEIVLCLTGSHTYGMEGSAWALESGHALLFPAGVPHDSWYSKIHHRSCTDLWLHLMPHGHVHLNVVEHRPPQKILSSGLLVSDFSLNEDLRRACALLYSEPMTVRHPPSGQVAAFLLFVLHRLLAHLAKSGFQDSPKAQREFLEQIKAHIVGNLADHLSLDNIARVAGYSPFHFHRIFSAVEGITPRQYIEQERLRKARQMLTSGYSVTAAAHDSGFGNCSHFNRTFKKHFGASPTIWLRQTH